MNDPQATCSEPKNCQETVILVIEDDPHLADFFHDYLQEDRHYHVLLASDGQAALQLAHSIHPDLLLIDMLLPDMPGLEVWQQLHAEKDLATVPALILSASASEQRAQQHHLSFLHKPFTLQELDWFLDRLCPPPCNH